MLLVVGTCLLSGSRSQRVAGRGSFNRHGRQEEEIGSDYLLIIFGFV